MKETRPAAKRSTIRALQFSLATLLLVFVVLASSLALFGGPGILVFGMVVAVAIAIAHMKSLAELLVIVMILGLLLGLLLPATKYARGSTRRSMCMDNLRQIALALHGYERANGHFPPAYVADKNGKPMHSWRVLLLPFLNEKALYKAYDFTEPWDGPRNRKLWAQRPTAYACPSDTCGGTFGAAQTSYVAVVGPKAAWSGAKPRKAVDFSGVEGNTIMVVEAADSRIAWTEPRDLSLESLAAGSGTAGLSVAGRHGRTESFFFTYERPYGANVALADGSVHYLSPGLLDPTGLPKLLEMGTFPGRDSRALEAPYPDGPRRLNWPNVLALVVWLASVALLMVKTVRSRRRLALQHTPTC
jgi:type II secretory pathway pseudopilin PulG